jgi:predicted permease
MGHHVQHPPLFPKIFLRLSLPPGILRESVCGVLAEDFRRQMRTDGLDQATRWYRREALRLAAYGLRRRFAWARRGLGVHRPQGGAPAPGPSPHHRFSPGRASLLQDIRFALRALRRAPGFTLVAAGTMALGIGATVMVFSVVDGVLLRTLPYPDADALVLVGFHRDGGRLGPTTGEFLDAWRAGSTQLSGITGSVTTRKVLAAPGEPTRLRGASVSTDYFQLLGVPFAVGAGFPPEYDEPGAPRAVIISHRLWRTRWASDPDIVGRSIVLDDTAFTVTGVIGAGFRPPDVLRHGDVDLWTPLALLRSSLRSRTDFFLQIAAKLDDGATPESVRQELQGVGAAVAETFPASYAEYLVPDVRPLHEQTVGKVTGRLFMLFGAVAFLLLIACTNVANLFLARGTDRVRELTIRAALGAGGHRVARLVLAESLAVALAGSAGGTALAFLGLRLFRRMSPGDIPRLAEVAVDLRVLAFAVALAVFTGVLFGLAPALAAARRDASAVLNDSSARASAGRRRLRLRGALIVAEVASAVVLCVGGGLLCNSFVRLSIVDPGFDPSRVETLPVRLGSAYSTQERRFQFFDGLLERVEALPGVTAATLTADLPLSGGITAAVYLEGDPANIVGWIQNHPVTPGYFATFGMALGPGSRPLPPGNGASRPVVVVNQAFARTYWDGEPALGKRLKYDDGPDAPWFDVIGLVNDVRFSELAEAPEPQIYYPYRSRSPYPIRQMYLAARTPTGAAPVGPAIRRIVREMDATLPVNAVIPMSDRVASSIAEPRFYATFLMTFAAVALVLAAVGIYATMAYMVGRRTQEMGIRMALGAPPARIVGLVLRQGGTLAALGAVLGLAAAAALSRVLAAFLFGITPTDPWTFAAAAALLGGVALTACLVPARRATRVDPVRALTAE